MGAAVGRGIGTNMGRGRRGRGRGRGRGRSSRNNPENETAEPSTSEHNEDDRGSESGDETEEHPGRPESPEDSLADEERYAMWDIEGSDAGEVAVADVKRRQT